MLLCPSDGYGEDKMDWGPGYTFHVPKTNYLGVFSGLNDGDALSDGVPAQHTLFATTAEVQEIEDGTSRTIGRGRIPQGRQRQRQSRRLLDESRRLPDIVRHPRSEFHRSRQHLLPVLPGRRQSQRFVAGPALRRRRRRRQLRQSPQPPSGRRECHLLRRQRAALLQDAIDTATWQSLGWIADGNNVNE